MRDDIYYMKLTCEFLLNLDDSDDSSQSGISLDAMAGVRKMDAALNLIKFSLFKRRCDIAHLPFLILACDCK